MQQPNAGNAPAMQGAPVAPTGADPAGAAGQPMAGEEMATPEEEALLEKAAGAVAKILHGKEKRDQVAKDLMGQGELYQKVSDVAYPMLMGMSQQAKDLGQGMDFWMALGTIAIDELFGIADAAGVPGADDPKQKEAALLDMVVRYGEENQDNPEAVEAAQQAASEMAQSGQIQEAMAMVGGEQNPVAQGVQQGLAAPRPPGVPA